MTKKRTFLFNKLVRDNVPSRLQERQVEVIFHSLSNNEYKTELYKKLFEEAHELVEAKTSLDITKELSDVWEILYAIGTMHNISQQDIEETRKKDFDCRGAFANKIYIESVTLNENNPHVAYYTAQPHKYPEKKMKGEQIKSKNADEQLLGHALKIVIRTKQ